MFTILLSIPKKSRHSNPNEVSWELVHSHFSDLFSNDFICVIKPYNGDHTQAKLYFKKKVTFAEQAGDFLINNSVPAKVIQRNEESNLPSSASGDVRLASSYTEAQLAPIQIDLEQQYQVEFQQTSPTTVNLIACHPDVLASAQTALRKWAAEQVSSATPSAGATAPATFSGSSSRARRPLFPGVVANGGGASNAGPSNQSQGATAAAAASTFEDVQYLRLLGPYDFELSLTDACKLCVQPRDITTLDCDVLVVTTSCSLSLNFGLARVVAAKCNRQAVQRQCQQRLQSSGNLKFGETHLVPAPPGSQLPARYLLFLALPNDARLTDSIDAVQFKKSMLDVIKSLLDTLARLPRDPVYRASSPSPPRRVAMTPLGATLPYWTDQSEDFAHVLAEAFHSRSADNLGDLRFINVCDLQVETLGTLGRVLEARFGVQLPRGDGAATQEGREFDAQMSAVEDSADEAPMDDATGDCDICCAAFDAQANPPKRFHCNRGRLCRRCVLRLRNQSLPNNGLCPLCMTRYQPAIGSQPANGNMQVVKQLSSLPGHEGHATLVVTYTFGGGIQSDGHPNPGRPYRGASRVTYFPDSPEGREIVDRLKRAFAGRSVFTVGTSATTGMENTVTWATVHHKTKTNGGPESHGYPDPTFLQRIGAELTALGY